MSKTVLKGCLADGKEEEAREDEGKVATRRGKGREWMVRMGSDR